MPRKNILCSIRGQPTTPFRYHDKGSLAIIGRWPAVAQIGRLRAFRGDRLAGLAADPRNVPGRLPQPRSGGHPMGLVVLSYDRGARLITGPLRREAERIRTTATKA